MDAVKLTVVGESMTGKTSLISYRIHHTFDSSISPTVAVNYARQKTTIRCPSAGDVEFTVNLWDTAGTERYHSLAAIYYKMSKVVLIVADATSPESFLQARTHWFDEIKRNVPEALVFLAVNKVDLVPDLERAPVRADEIAAFCAENDIVSWEYTSACTGRNVDRLFNSIYVCLAKVYQRVPDHETFSVQFELANLESIDDSIEIPRWLRERMERIQTPDAHEPTDADTDVIDIDSSEDPKKKDNDCC
eukprot:gnl/Chilomastix_cuspidata/1135.p2 GENE.gnl/Chilomastix_cuspidata/1135~~gnl/Chilomastix_cuspidata/1135.p2  ORF type:complete len:248 (-),score=112.99 gnl/Chilomastix_cuspidata/1135:70-813(-)